MAQPLQMWYTDTGQAEKAHRPEKYSERRYFYGNLYSQIL